MPRAKKHKATQANPPTSSTPKLPLIVVAACIALAAVIYTSISRPDSLPISSSAITIPTTNRTIQPLYFEVPCSSDQRCSASTKCGRAIQDNFIKDEEAILLRDMMKKAIQNGGGGGIGGPTIFDLSTGAITYKDKFISLYTIFDEMKTNEDFKGIWSLSDYELLVGVVEKVHDFIVHMFGVKGELYPTKPLFFSFIEANRAPQRANDEYVVHRFPAYC